MVYSKPVVCGENVLERRTVTEKLLRRESTGKKTKTWWPGHEATEQGMTSSRPGWVVGRETREVVERGRVLNLDDVLELVIKAKMGGVELREVGVPLGLSEFRLDYSLRYYARVDKPGAIRTYEGIYTEEFMRGRGMTVLAGSGDDQVDTFLLGMFDKVRSVRQG